jgi:hypothetical protein
MRNNGEYELFKRHYDHVKIKNGGCYRSINGVKTCVDLTYARERYLKELDELKGEEEESEP